MNVTDVQLLVERLYGSRQVSEMIEGEERFPIAFRLPVTVRDDPQQLAAMTFKAPDGALVRLDQVATSRHARGPILINQEQLERCAVVTSNVEGRDWVAL